MMAAIPSQLYTDDSYQIADRIKAINEMMSELSQIAGRYLNDNLPFEDAQIDDERVSSEKIIADLTAMKVNMETIESFCDPRLVIEANRVADGAARAKDEIKKLLAGSSRWR
jgi:hypothetical protein